jgi:SAICAR synthetase
MGAATRCLTQLDYPARPDCRTPQAARPGTGGMALAIRVNDVLFGLFLGVGIHLIDFKMECGRLWEGDLMRVASARCG